MSIFADRFSHPFSKIVCSSARNTYESSSVTEDFATISWPGTSPLAAMLPTPESTWGEVWSESSDYYSAYIGNTTKAQYESYVNACMEKGFTVDNSAASDQSGISPEFKAAMDSYEQFFDQYIAFMKKYSESSDPASLLGEYSEFMQKYTETMNAMNAWDSSEMTPEESAYYLEVTNRINQKLLEAAV